MFYNTIQEKVSDYKYDKLAMTLKKTLLRRDEMRTT